MALKKTKAQSNVSEGVKQEDVDVIHHFNRDKTCTKYLPGMEAPETQAQRNEPAMQSLDLRVRAKLKSSTTLTMFFLFFDSSPLLFLLAALLLLAPSAASSFGGGDGGAGSSSSMM